MHDTYLDYWLARVQNLFRLSIHQCPLSHLETFVHAVGVILSLLLQEGCSHGVYGFECEPDYAETVITALTWNFIESSQATFIVNFSLSLFL